MKNALSLFLYFLEYLLSILNVFCKLRIYVTVIIEKPWKISFPGNLPSRSADTLFNPVPKHYNQPEQLCGVRRTTWDRLRAKNDERKVRLAHWCLALNRRADVYVSNANNYVYLPDINGMARRRHHGVATPGIYAAPLPCNNRHSNISRLNI